MTSKTTGLVFAGVGLASMAVFFVACPPFHDPEIKCQDSSNCPTSFHCSNNVCTKGTDSVADSGTSSDIDAGTSPEVDAGTQGPPVKVTLNIPGRVEWATDNGYSGELSIQTVALYYGAWISQSLVRAKANGDVLLGGDGTKSAAAVLDAFGFQYTEWSSSSTSQYEEFMLWVKQNLAKGFPVIIGIYQKESKWSTYDKMVVVTGVNSTNSLAYNGDDEFIINTGFGDQVKRKASTLLAVRGEDCAFSEENGGCIPGGKDYGVAVTGVKDAPTTVIIPRIAVDKPYEPNIGDGEKTIQLVPTATCSNLIPRQNYALLRFHTASAIPFGQSLRTYLESSASDDWAWVTSEQWTVIPTLPIDSGSAAFYRCAGELPAGQLLQP